LKTSLFLRPILFLLVVVAGIARSIRPTGHPKNIDQGFAWRREILVAYLVFAVSILVASEALAMQKEEGIVKIPSHHSVEETVDKLKAILQSKGVTLFALVDHSGEAEKVGLKMPPTKLLIFGNPKGGTPLMLASPSVAIDLPLKILIAEDSRGRVWISCNSAVYLKERHDLPQSLLPNIAVVETLAAAVGE
jgi:uncharacterized protein (DUF302 family)